MAKYVIYFAIRHKLGDQESPTERAEDLRQEIVKKLQLPNKSVFVFQILDIDNKEFLPHADLPKE